MATVTEKVPVTTGAYVDVSKGDPNVAVFLDTGEVVRAVVSSLIELPAPDVDAFFHIAGPESYINGRVATRMAFIATEITSCRLYLRAEMHDLDAIVVRGDGKMNSQGV